MPKSNSKIMKPSTKSKVSVMKIQEQSNRELAVITFTVIILLALFNQFVQAEDSVGNLFGKARIITDKGGSTCGPWGCPGKGGGSGGIDLGGGGPPVCTGPGCGGSGNGGVIGGGSGGGTCTSGTCGGGGQQQGGCSSGNCGGQQQGGCSGGGGGCGGGKQQGGAGMQMRRAGPLQKLRELALRLPILKGLKSGAKNYVGKPAIGNLGGGGLGNIGSIGGIGSGIGSGLGNIGNIGNVGSNLGGGGLGNGLGSGVGSGLGGNCANGQCNKPNLINNGNPSNMFPDNFIDSPCANGQCNKYRSNQKDDLSSNCLGGVCILEPRGSTKNSNIASIKPASFFLSKITNLG